MRRFLLMMPLVATACSTPPSASPSLLPRPIERRSDAEPIVPTPVATPDPALDAQISANAERLAAAVKAFDTALGPASERVAAARGRAPGSERWLDAQVALGTLDAPRTETSAAASALAQLAIDRGTAGLPEYPALADAERSAEQSRATQAAAVGRLTSGLAP